MSSAPDLSAHLAARPWLEQLLSPCLTARSWGVDRIDRLKGFGRYAQAQRTGLLEAGHLPVAAIDELIGMMQAVDAASGAQKMAAIDGVFARAIALTTQSSRLAESEAMRPRRRSTRQPGDAEQPKKR